jgi:HEAT repeat
VTNKFRYEFVRPTTRNELTSQLESGDPEAVAKALYSATRYEEDWKWVQDQCLKCLESPEVSVRWAAVTCLGDLAFLRRPLDIHAVLPALEEATKDPKIADPARFSVSMVKQFVGSK